MRDIIFIRAVTHYIYLRNFHFVARPSERGFEQARGEDAQGKGGKKRELSKRKKKRIFKHPSCEVGYIGSLFLVGRRSRSISSRDFRIFKEPRDKTTRAFIENNRRRSCRTLQKRKTRDARKLLGGECIVHARKERSRPRGVAEENLSRVRCVCESERSNRESSPADRRQNARAFFEVGAAGRRLINGDKRDENGFDLAGQRERD